MILYQSKGYQMFLSILVLTCALCMTGCQGTDRVLMVPAAEDAADQSETAGQDESEMRNASGEDSDRINDSVAETSAESGRTDRIFVHVCGAVRQPGVVELPAGSRAVDALNAAGGFAEDADTQAVNLAAKVSDGQKLYFPVPGEEWESEAGIAESAGGTAESADATAGRTAGLVNINTADAALLCTLPGVGAAKAQAIIAYREAHGAFAQPEDIMKVAGVKESVYSKISDRICVK